MTNYTVVNPKTVSISSVQWVGRHRHYELEYLLPRWQRYIWVLLKDRKALTGILR